MCSTPDSVPFPLNDTATANMYGTVQFQPPQTNNNSKCTLCRTHFGFAQMDDRRPSYFTRRNSNSRRLSSSHDRHLILITIPDRHRQREHIALADCVFRSVVSRKAMMLGTLRSPSLALARPLSLFPCPLFRSMTPRIVCATMYFICARVSESLGPAEAPPSSSSSDPRVSSNFKRGPPPCPVDKRQGRRTGSTRDES